MTAYEAIQYGAALVDLSARGRLVVTGEDAARLLHAITTNDIKGLADNRGLSVFFLNAQGRILGDAYIYRRGEVYVLDTEPETADKLRDHIDKYIIADDAEVKALAGWSTLGIEGPKAAEHVAAAGITSPESPLSTNGWKNGFIAKVASTTSCGFRVIAPAHEIAQLRDSLVQNGLVELTAEEARITRIANGIPRYGDDISERYLVQETGLLDAVHFNKGCYLGQEIVERVRSRAQVHRHLRAIQIDGDQPPASGSKLQSDGKDVGEVTSTAYSPHLRRVVGFAYLRTEAVETKPEMVVEASGASARLAGKTLSSPVLDG